MPVTLVVDSEMQDPSGNFVAAYEITYEIPDRPGAVFTFQVPRQPDPVASAAAKIAEITQEVGNLYSLG
jgi:hypothetical protein